MKFSKLIAILVSSLVWTTALSSEQWQVATFRSESRTGDIMLVNCHYETIGGYRFSIVTRGSCPVIVKINPESGQVKVQ